MEHYRHDFHFQAKFDIIIGHKSFFRNVDPTIVFVTNDAVRSKLCSVEQYIHDSHSQDSPETIFHKNMLNYYICDTVPKSQLGSVVHYIYDLYSQSITGNLLLVT